MIFSLKQEYPSRKYGRRWDLAFLLWLGRSYHTNIFDHARAVKDLLKAGIDCYMSIETAEAVGATYHHRYVVSLSDEQMIIDKWVVLPFDLHHDVPCQGYLIAAPDGEKLLFVPDTPYIRNRFEKVDIIAIECNHLSESLSKNIQGGNIPATVGRRIRHNHISLETTINFLKANDLSKCRHIYLLHLSDSNSDEARMVKVVHEATGIPCTACGE